MVELHVSKSRTYRAYLLVHNLPLDLLAGISLGLSRGDVRSVEFWVGIGLLIGQWWAKVLGDVLYFKVMRNDVVRAELNGT